MSSVNVENLLYDAIGDSFENFRSEELGSEKRKAAHSETTQLLDRAIELERIEVEREEKAAARESERLMKERQMKFDKGKIVLELIVGAVTLAANMAFTCAMINRSMKFEKTDSFTSTAGRENVRRGVTWMFKK
jgi:hypothetical protein